MSECVLTALIVTGAVFEIGGLGLLAADLLSAGRRKAALTRPDQLVQVGGIAHEREIGMPIVVGGQPVAQPEPTLAERVELARQRIDELVARLERLDEKIDNKVDALSDQAAGWVAEARREAFEALQEARGLLGQEVGAHLGRRWFGMGLFVVGLALNTLGNVLSI